MYRAPAAAAVRRTAAHPRRWSSTSAKLIDFSDAQSVYKAKSTTRLIKAYLTLRLCTVRPLVKNADWLCTLGEKVLGTRLFHGLVVKKTFFQHFCGGEEVNELGSFIGKLKKLHIGAILDYAAEEDVKHDEAKKDDNKQMRQRGDVVSARIFDYHGEQECDHNCDRVLESIQHASHINADTGKKGEAFCAIKLTALCKPAVLEKMNKILIAIRRSWLVGFTNAPVEEIPDQEMRVAVSHPNALKPIGIDAWKAGLKKLCTEQPPTDAEAEAMFMVLARGGDTIDYLDFTRMITLQALRFELEGGELPEYVKKNELRAFTHSGALPLLTETETILVDNLVKRINKVAEAALEHQVNVMVDAEQTYMQGSIDHFTLLLQRIYNKPEFGNPRIYNTYQCYKTYSKNRIENDLERARREGWNFAGKLVRGAYMIQERDLAATNNYESPILSDLEATHRNFDECVSLLLDLKPQNNIGMLVGTHNKESIELILNKMKERGIDKMNGGVYFGQLMGMADQLTFPLGANGYNAYKYVPYGPVKEVMPYLIRRAQENSSMDTLCESELTLLRSEIKRRLFKVSSA